MKRTLLDYTQNILGALNSDSVNSISDTTESLQVAEILRTAYYNILGRAELPEHEKLFQLTASPGFNASSIVTITIASPGVITWTAHGLVLNSQVVFTTTGTLPTGITAGVVYYVQSIPTVNTFTISATIFGPVINTTGTQSGTQTASATILTPTLMFRPNEGVAKLNYVQYFNSNPLGSLNQQNVNVDHDLDLDLAQDQLQGGVSPPAFSDIDILPNKDFMDMQNTLDPTQSNVGTFLFNDQLYTATEVLDTFPVNYRNDKQPQFCTVIQNYYFIFDSYDSTQDAGLQSAKTLASGFITPTWQAIDTFVPDLDDWAVPLLLNEAKALAFYELKQTIHPHAEREIDRQWVSLQKTKAVVNKPSWFDQLPNFGRRKWWP